MTAVYHSGLIQGSDEWHQARCGLLTASEMHLIVTPTLKLAQNEKTRAHLYELLAQRVTRYVEPSYIGDNMLRGWEDEVEAALIYSKKRAPVDAVGFVTNDKWGFTLRPAPQPALPVYNRPSLDTLPSEYVLRRLHGADGAAQRIASYFHAVTRRNAAVRGARGQVWL